MATIDFTATAQNSKDLIEYFNDKGEVVKTYHISELDKYVEKNALSIYSVSANGKIGIDPNIIEKEMDMGTEAYIDENWLKVTQDFYNAMNQTEHIANTKPQQNRGI